MVGRGMFSVELDRGLYLPGEQLSGRLILNTQKQIQPKEISLILAWKTHGKADMDFQIIDKQIIAAPQISAENLFQFQLPDFPWTYEGQLISIQWFIEASVSKGPIIEKSFKLQPSWRT